MNHIFSQPTFDLLSCSRYLLSVIEAVLPRPQGYSVNEHIRNAKAFRNPDILEKLVNYFEVGAAVTRMPIFRAAALNWNLTLRTSMFKGCITVVGARVWHQLPAFTV